MCVVLENRKMSHFLKEPLIPAENITHNNSKACVQRSKWSQSQRLLLIGEIRESFMEEVTFELGCEKAFLEKG